MLYQSITRQHLITGLDYTDVTLVNTINSLPVSGLFLRYQPPQQFGPFHKTFIFQNICSMNKYVNMQNVKRKNKTPLLLNKQTNIYFIRIICILH